MCVHIHLGEGGVDCDIVTSLPPSPYAVGDFPSLPQCQPEGGFILCFHLPTPKSNRLTGRPSARLRVVCHASKRARSGSAQGKARKASRAAQALSALARVPGIEPRALGAL